MPALFVSRFASLLVALALAGVSGCASSGAGSARLGDRIPVLVDSDANNEIDDQHAIAYALFNGDVFDVVGITVNRTRNGGGLDRHVAEAERVVRLSASRVPVVAGADAGYDDIVGQIGRPGYDGQAAVDFIIEQAHRSRGQQLVLLPIGKLTNVALALAQDPTIAPLVRVVWLGSNYPAPGEYNQRNDEPALNAVLDSEVEFEIVTVRYGQPSGSAAVRATPAMIEARVAGRGPRLAVPVEGRDGGTFSTFGDYAADLFSRIELNGTPPSRALFDVVAVAIVKDPTLGQARSIPAPRLVDGQWVERPDNPRRITVWHDFDRERVLEEFFGTMENPTLAP